MILVKNRLKRLKRDNEDDMLYYLKYSHLENIPDEEDFTPVIRTYKNKATQFPDIRNKSTQTYKKEMDDKETDTFDDLHKIDYKYILHGKSHRLKSNEKLRGDFMGQVNTVPVVEKDDENKDRESDDDDDDDNFLTRNVKRGFRLAEFALNSSIATANLTMYIADALVETNLFNNSSNNDEEEHEHINENDLEVISVNSSPPMTVSSATPPQTVHSSVPTSPQSIPVPTSPQSSRASSRSRSSLYNPKKRM